MEREEWLRLWKEENTNISYLLQEWIGVRIFLFLHAHLQIHASYSSFLRHQIVGLFQVSSKANRDVSHANILIGKQKRFITCYRLACLLSSQRSSMYNFRCRHSHHDSFHKTHPSKQLECTNQPSMKLFGFVSGFATACRRYTTTGTSPSMQDILLGRLLWQS